MRIFLTGASGLIGMRLTRELIQQGHTVIALTRSVDTYKNTQLFRQQNQAKEAIQVVQGDPTQPGSWQASLKGCDVVVALAGEPISGRRWTAKVKKRIEDSRVESMKRLAEALGAIPVHVRPKRLVCASAVGYYGDTGERIVKEEEAPGSDFLAQVCAKWEAAAYESAACGVQVTPLRIGMVLDKEGGALKKMLPLFRMGLGGSIGSGKQYLSWIHIADIIGLICFCVTLPFATQTGPLNATAPAPITMHQFALALGAVLRRPHFLGVPGGMVRALWGESANVLLHGQRAIPQRAIELGYDFKFPLPRQALLNLLGKDSLQPT